MAYTINLTDGQIFATVADGAIDTSSSMTLVGKNYAGYGAFLDENFIHLLENGSNTTPPGAPLTGQLWWDKTNNLLKVYNGSVFKTISAATSSSTAPTSNVTGDLWYDTSNQLLKVWTGTQWLTVGPSVVSGTGVQAATIYDGVTNHSVVEFYVAGQLMAILSKDNQFQPANAIAGFSVVNPGFQLSSLSAGYLLNGTATNSQALNSLSSNSFVRSDVNTSTTGTLAVLNNAGLTVGNNQDFKASVTGANVTLSNQTSNGNLYLQVNQGGSPINAIVINGSTGVVSIPSLSGNIAGGNVTVTNLINAGGNTTGNIGTTGGYFNTVFANTFSGTSTTARYADVAERFAADSEYAPGTVVELGGLAEITCSNTELSESVFGVISTRAAYLMNSDAGTNKTHPPVAMTGRVPVRVVGSVQKGDRLVSAGNGLARAARAGEATAFNVIGRSLVEKLDNDEGVVEAIVTIK